MEQRRRMNKFNEAGERNVPVLPVAAQFCREEQKNGPKPLPSAEKEMLANG